MDYTVQTHADSGNWACPDGTQSLSFVTNKRDAEGVLQDWSETVGRYDDERCASALVWVGHHDDTTDLYPDFVLTFGPRMGVRWEPA